MKSKTTALIRLFHQLQDTCDPEEIQTLLTHIHTLNSQLTFEQRTHVYSDILREAREQALFDARRHELSPVARAMLEELKVLNRNVYGLAPVGQEAAEALRDRLQGHAKKLNGEKDPVKVHQAIQEITAELEAQPDKSLRALGFYMLRENLESRILGAAMTQPEAPCSVSLFTELHFARIPSLALSLLRFNAGEGSYYLAGAQELAESETLAGLKAEVQQYRDILAFATASEAADYAAQIRSGILYRLLAWIHGAGPKAQDQGIAACVNSILDLGLRQSHLTDCPVPTYRVANVLHTTLRLAAEEDPDAYRSIAEDQGPRLDMCSALAPHLLNFTLFCLVLRLYQFHENTEAAMSPVVEALLRLYLALNLSDVSLAQDNIRDWVLEVQG